MLTELIVFRKFSRVLELSSFRDYGSPRRGILRREPPEEIRIPDWQSPRAVPPDNCLELDSAVLENRERLPENQAERLVELNESAFSYNPLFPGIECNPIK